MTIKTNLPAIMISALLAGACGQPVSNEPLANQASSPPVHSDRRPLPGEFFNKPLGQQGIRVQTAEEAEKHLPFNLNWPDDLPTPEVIQTTDPSRFSRFGAVVSWVFRSQELGHFVLQQSVTIGGKAAQDNLEEDATESPGCETRSFTAEEQVELGPAPGGEVTTCRTGGGRVVSIRDGERAILSDGPFETNLIWLVPLQPQGNAFSDVEDELALEIRLVGPIDQFSTEQALAAAERV